MNGQWSAEQIRRAGEQVTEWLAGFYGTLEERPITPAITPAEADALFAGELPRQGAGFAAALRAVEETVVPNSLLIPHPRYFGLMNPTPTMPSIWAETVVSALNQNLGAWSHSPVGTAVERRMIRWFCAISGLPEGAFGTFCSGGSVANLIGLRMAVADRLPESLGGGLQALREPPCFYVSSEAHFSFRKAAGVLGLGTNALRLVPADRRSRIDVGALRARIREDRAAGLRPFAVVGIAGTTSAGAVDPLEELAEVAREHGLWYHVDAAWGSGVLLSERFRGLLRGIERADSITFDPHKWLFLPLGSGAILARDGERMRSTFETKAVYIPTDDDARTDFRSYGIAGSRRNDALKLWISVQALGVGWYERVIDRHMELTHWLAERITDAADWEIVVPPELNILCFRYVPEGVPDEEVPALQDRVAEMVVQEGSSWISPTTVCGVRAIRWMALSPALTREDTEAFWTTLRRVAAGVGSPLAPGTTAV